MSDKFNIFNIAPNYHFIKSLFNWLEKSFCDRLSQVKIFLPNHRSCFELRQLILTEKPAMILPKIRAISDICYEDFFDFLPNEEAKQLIDEMLEINNLSDMDHLFFLTKEVQKLSIFGGSLKLAQAFKIAVNLQALFNDIEEEGIDLKKLATIDDSNLSQHRLLTLDFLKDFYVQNKNSLLRQNISFGSLNQNFTILKFSQLLEKYGSKFPVIIAGSTASINCTKRLIGAVAQKNYVILSGVKEENFQTQNHPQFFLNALLDSLKVEKKFIQEINDDKFCLSDKSRQELISLMMLPACETVKWQEISKYLNVAKVTLDLEKNFCLIEAKNEVEEAKIIALILQENQAHKKNVALISNNSRLTKLVMLELKQMALNFNNSSSLSIFNSALVNFILLILELTESDFNSYILLALLKNPLCHYSKNQKILSDFEIKILRQDRIKSGFSGIIEQLKNDRILGRFFENFCADIETLKKLQDEILFQYATENSQENSQENYDNNSADNFGSSEKPGFFKEFLGGQVCEQASVSRYTCSQANLSNNKITKKDSFSELPFVDSGLFLDQNPEGIKAKNYAIKNQAIKNHGATNRSLANYTLAVIEAAQNLSKKTWQELLEPETAQIELFEFFARLKKQDDFIIDPESLVVTFRILFGQIRYFEKSDSNLILLPAIQILSPIEARLLNYDLVIVASLNEGDFPEIVAENWLGKKIKKDLGVEKNLKKIGQNAYDFCNYLSNKSVVLTRCCNKNAALLIESPFVLKFKTLCQKIGVSLNRGEKYFAALKKINNCRQNSKMSAPAPAPKIELRPQKISITEITKLISNPYIIYAKKILQLEELKKIDFEPGYAEFGSFVHKALEDYVKNNYEKNFIKKAAQIFDEYFLSQELKLIWWPKFEKIFSDFVAENEKFLGLQNYVEIIAEAEINKIIISGKIDRIIINNQGFSEIFDYKTGQIPPKKDIIGGINPQLTIAALMIMEGAVKNLPVKTVSALNYWKLSALTTKEITRISAAADEIKILVAAARSGLERLFQHFACEKNGYVATENDEKSEYKNLIRSHEWK